MPTFGSLFAGIGGIDLGLQRAGWTGRWQVEYEPFCQRVLAAHWPDVTRYGDIHDVDWSQVEPVDLIAGGFPCQPFSVAGKRRGKDDDRWLWPEFARAVGALRPRYVLVENVPGLLGGHGGMGSVLGDLAALGYDAEWDLVPAAAVGAPHLRYRVWIVAHARCGRVWPDGGCGQAHGESRSPEGAEDKRKRGWHPASGGGTALADAHGQGSQGWSVQPERAGQQPPWPGGMADSDGFRWDGRSGFFGPGWRRELADGGGWLTEPDVGRVAHGVPARVDRLRALGNAVVPQVVEFIGRRIIEAEGLT